MGQESRCVHCERVEREDVEDDAEPAWIRAGRISLAESLSVRFRASYRRDCVGSGNGAGFASNHVSPKWGKATRDTDGPAPRWNTLPTTRNRSVPGQPRDSDSGDPRVTLAHLA